MSKTQVKNVIKNNYLSCSVSLCWQAEDINFYKYCNNPKYWDRHASANNIDPEQTAEYDVWSGSTLFVTHPALF